MKINLRLYQKNKTKCFLLTLLRVLRKVRFELELELDSNSNLKMIYDPRLLPSSVIMIE